MKERKLVHQFTLNTEIYKVELPQKVLEALREAPLDASPRFYYEMDILFDKAVYQTHEFFQYPLEKIPASPPRRRVKMTQQEQLHERLVKILRKQLSSVLLAVKDAGIDLSGGAIIGGNLEHPHCVSLKFYEGNEKEYNKNGILKQNVMVRSIMPDQPFIIEKATEVFAKMLMEKARENAKREQEQASHIPHMVPSRELFAAAAKAILLDHRRKTVEEVTALADQLRLHAEIQSDWPLEIASAKNPLKLIAEDSEIDCPEFLLYHENTNGNWILKKVNNLAAAQAEITRQGYNLKTTARMAVLRQLRPLGFTLFTNTPEGLVKVSKQKATGVRNLNLAWKQ